MDYRQWVDSVRSFTARVRDLPGEIDVLVEIGVPALQEQIDAVELSWPRGIPKSPRDLWSEGSWKVNCPYLWAPGNDLASRIENLMGRDRYVCEGAQFLDMKCIFPNNSNVDDSLVGMREVV